MTAKPAFRFVPCTVKGHPGYEIHHEGVHLGWTGKVPEDDEDAQPGWWRLWPRWGDEPSYTADLVFRLRLTGAERLVEYHLPRLKRHATK